jgi:hypothetical protein
MALRPPATRRTTRSLPAPCAIRPLRVLRFACSCICIPLMRAACRLPRLPSKRASLKPSMMQPQSAEKATPPQSPPRRHWSALSFQVAISAQAAHDRSRSCKTGRQGSSACSTGLVAEHRLWTPGALDRSVHPELWSSMLARSVWPAFESGGCHRSGKA